jgi:hypothetical protein
MAAIGIGGIGDFWAAGLTRLLPRPVSAARDSIAPLPELSSVVAASEIHDSGKTVPKGAEGAIVFVHDGGIGYEVEFIKPIHAVVSASRQELEPA